MFHRTAYENSRPDGFSVLEVVPARPDAVEYRLFVPLTKTELKGEVLGPLADLCLVQTFCYTTAQCPQTLEAVYRFPLPGDAAVTGVTVRFGNVTLEVAELKEREQAEKDYQEAKQEGRQAALTTRESPDVFTLHLAGLQPDQEVRVETHYVQLARTERGRWILRVPLTTSPRYVRDDEGGSRHAHGQPLALLRDPGHRFSLDLRVSHASDITSPTHTLETQSEGDSLRVRLQQGEVLPDRDCVLSWSPLQDRQNPALRVLLHDDKAAHQVYFLALVTPPAQRLPGGGVPREAILLVDHSGSMEGPKWAAADWAVIQFLSGLTAQDHFALGLFHDTTRWLAPRTLPADADTVKGAIEFLEENRYSGGTELGMALEQGLHLPRTTEERARHLLIVTDAEVSDSERILRLAREEAQKKAQRRISVLCIDAAPNSFLVQALAEQGGGVAKFLTSQPDEEDITTALDTILEEWTAPLLTGLRLEVNRAQAFASGHAVLGKGSFGGTAIDVGDLPAGRAIWIAGRVPHEASPDLSFRLTNAEGKEITACRCDLTASEAQRPAIKALFGAQRLLALEFLMNSHESPEEIIAHLDRLGYKFPAESQWLLTGKRANIYSEYRHEEMTKALRQLLVQESLDYGLACAETAFVATRKEAGKVVESTVVVANALPTGWSESFLGQLAFMPCSLTLPSAASPTRIYDKRVLTPLSAAGMSKQDTTVRYRAGKKVAASASVAIPQQSLEKLPAQGEALFTGTPVFTAQRATLFDTSGARSLACLAQDTTFTALQIHFLKGVPEADTLDSGLTLLLYVEDITLPVARVRLADLVRQHGKRPLNLRYRQGQSVRLVLEDPNGAWAQSAPEMEVRFL